MNTKRKSIDSDSDEEDDAQMRLFLEAADHTLLTDDMFKKPTTNSSSENACVEPPVTTVPAVELPKSERYLAEEEAVHSTDLQISKEMQTHLWGKLSAIIQSQIEFSTKEPKSIELNEEESTWYSRVKLVANADCYVVDDIEVTQAPQKKPKIRKRQPEGERQEPITDAMLASVTVDGDSILSSQDMKCWATGRKRKNKIFEYKASDPSGLKLHAIEPTNEFSKERRKNKWNESKISERFNKNKTTKGGK